MESLVEPSTKYGELGGAFNKVWRAWWSLQQSMESLVEPSTKYGEFDGAFNKAVFCNCYNPPPHLSNLWLQEVWHSPNTLSTVIHGQVFRIITWNPCHIGYENKIYILQFYNFDYHIVFSLTCSEKLILYGLTNTCDHFMHHIRPLSVLFVRV